MRDMPASLLAAISGFPLVDHSFGAGNRPWAAGEPAKCADDHVCGVIQDHEKGAEAFTAAPSWIGLSAELLHDLQQLHVEHERGLRRNGRR